MAEINGITLMMAIQAVDEKISQLLKNLDLNKSDSRLNPKSEGELNYLAYWKASIQLKDAYMSELKNSSNLPPYEDLVKN